MPYLNQIRALLITIPIICFTLLISQHQSVSQEKDTVDTKDKTVCSFINTDNVNVRQDHSLESEVITQLQRGQGVRAEYREGDWVKIDAIIEKNEGNQSKTRPLDGWVANDYINGCSEDQFDLWRQ